MKTSASPSELKIPIDLRKILSANPKVKTLWEDLTPIARRDFVSWIESAKQLETRKRRIEVTCSKLLSGKRRPCCYAVIPMNLYKALGTNPKAKATWKDLTPDERRDFVSFIETAKDKKENQLRIEKVCIMLASGKNTPKKFR
jgi:uncharacterized protein YdeI (YjbR/CyaY-like superfamily)